MFGELIGLCLAQAWIEQGRPTPFTLAELGPGRGTLMADVISDKVLDLFGFHRCTGCPNRRTTHCGNSDTPANQNANNIGKRIPTQGKTRFPKGQCEDIRGQIGEGDCSQHAPHGPRGCDVVNLVQSPGRPHITSSKPRRTQMQTRNKIFDDIS